MDYRFDENDMLKDVVSISINKTCLVWDNKPVWDLEVTTNEGSYSMHASTSVDVLCNYIKRDIREEV